MQSSLPSGLRITELKNNDIPKIATLLSLWQENTQFNAFLREIPSTPEQNNQFIRDKLQGDFFMAHIAKVSGEVAGILFLHSFDPSGSLEESIRIAPHFQQKGIGTHIKRVCFKEALQVPEINSIVSWHSAWNQGTFHTNKNCGGTIIDFVEEQTFLPNIQKTTDDFQWKISQVCDGTNPIHDIINSVRREIIMCGLRKHNFIS